MTDSLRETLYLAALLAGEGPRASALADEACGWMAATRGRSCVEAGTTLQLRVDTGPLQKLRYAVPVADSRALLTGDSGSAGARLQQALEDVRAAAGAAKGPLGTWLMRAGATWSAYVDLRCQSPRAAALRLAPLLDDEGKTNLERALVLLEVGEPWLARIEAHSQGLRRVHLGWRLFRERDPEAAVRRWQPEASFSAIKPVLQTLLGGPLSPRQQPWLIWIPLDSESPPGLRLGSSLWARRPDDERKRTAIRSTFHQLGGDASHAEAMLSLLSGRVPKGNRWVVARALDVSVTEARTKVSVMMVPWPGLAPQLQEDAPTGEPSTSSSSARFSGA